MGAMAGQGPDLWVAHSTEALFVVGLNADFQSGVDRVQFFSLDVLQNLGIVTLPEPASSGISGGTPEAFDPAQAVGGVPQVLGDDFVFDATAPVVSASLVNDTGISDQDSVTSDPVFSGSVSDDDEVTGLFASLSNGGVSAGFVDVSSALEADGSFTLDAALLEQVNGGQLDQGLQTLTLFARDETGSESARHEVKFAVDTSAPVVTSAPSGTLSLLPSTLRLEFDGVLAGGDIDESIFTLTDAQGVPVEIASVARTGGSHISLTLETALPNGDFTLDVAGGLTDLAGNVSSPASFDFSVLSYIDDTAPLAGFDHVVFHFDGNIRDKDDIAALPVTAALMTAAGIEDDVTFFHSNNLAEGTNPNRYNGAQADLMRNSADFADKLGITTYNYMDDTDAATAALVEIFNSGEKILSVEGGPMEAVYRALEQTSADNLTNITLLSHNSWNEERDVVEREDFFGVPRTWDDIERDFPTVQLVEIRDQNQGDNNDTGFNNRNWAALDATDNEVLAEMRDAMLMAGEQRQNDPSDAGMAFYALTGITDGTPEQAIEYLLDSPFLSFADDQASDDPDGPVVDTPEPPAGPIVGGPPIVNVPGDPVDLFFRGPFQFSDTIDMIGQFEFGFELP